MVFLSTPSARRATCTDPEHSRRDVYFYPRPPRGGRRQRDPADEASELFLSTPSARRATSCPICRMTGVCNFYPRPPRGGRQARRSSPAPLGRISIHALREEGDYRTRSCRIVLGNFYPRPPRGGRQLRFSLHPRSGRFLSTPSARRATCTYQRGCPQYRHFYPRPPRGGRLAAKGNHQISQNISIHALREEGDVPSASAVSLSILDFYPRPPRGGRRPCPS